MVNKFLSILDIFSLGAEDICIGDPAKEFCFPFVVFSIYGELDVAPLYEPSDVSDYKDIYRCALVYAEDKEDAIDLAASTGRLRPPDNTVSH